MKKTTSTPQWVLLCGWILLIQPVIAQVNSLSTRVFDKKSVQPNTVIVDVRTPAEWRAGQPVWRQSGVLQAAELEKIITPHTV